MIDHPLGPMALACASLLFGCRPGADEVEAERPNPDAWVSSQDAVAHCQPGFLEDDRATGLSTDDLETAAKIQPWSVKLCGPGTVPMMHELPAAPRRAPLPQAPRPQVWVDTKSGGYHCEGSRYYQSTPTGKLMSEQAAIAAGHVSAENRKCS